MTDSIHRIIGGTSFRNHLYESGEKLKLVEAEVLQAEANGQLSINLYVEYGKTLLEAGRTGEAIATFEKLLEQLPQFKTVTQETKTLHEALAVSYLRLGEQINCQENHSSDSCLFPIKGDGVHIDQTGSQKAITAYQNILSVFPEDLQSRWLLNLAYMTLGDYPDSVPELYLIPPKLFESEYAVPSFENISMYTGLDVNELAGGVILDDFDNDHLIDVMVSSWGMFGSIKWFKNMGDGQFEDRTEAAGLANVVGGLNLIQADYNNDGNLDFYVTRGAWRGSSDMGILPNALFKNNGNGSFTDSTIPAGMYSESPSQSASWVDINTDGLLDLFVGNETHSTKELFPSQLFLNQGDGSFKEVAKEAGLELVAYVKGTATSDINNDGRPDLYASIINGPNRLFLNKAADSPLSFELVEIAESAGVTEPIESFPTWFFDYDNDGWEDLFVSCYDIRLLKKPTQEVAADYLGLPTESDTPRLYRNNGDGTFTDKTLATKLDLIVPTMGSNYGDIDNDGFTDFYLGTGAPDYRSVVPNRMFRNSAGQHFMDVTTAGNFGHLQKGHGVGFADLDNDGDQDIYAVMGGSYSGDVFQNALFENPGNANRSITIKLVGNSSNASAIGAKIKLTVSGQPDRTIYHTISSGGSFGANSLQAEIGLGSATQINKIEVDWPDGKVGYTDYGPYDIARGIIISIKEGSTEIEPLEVGTFKFDRNTDHSHH